MSEKTRAMQFVILDTVHSLNDTSLAIRHEWCPLKAHSLPTPRAEIQITVLKNAKLQSDSTKPKQSHIQKKKNPHTRVVSQIPGSIQSVSHSPTQKSTRRSNFLFLSGSGLNPLAPNQGSSLSPQSPAAPDRDSLTRSRKPALPHF